MERPVYVIGHRSPDTDSVCSAIAYAALKQQLGEQNVRPARAGELNAETRFVLRHFEVPAPELLVDAAGVNLILVDHNEVGQALPHLEQANILEIWEHHRLGDLRLPRPIVFHCEPVGATATLISELHFVRGVVPARAMAGLMLSAILSDTLGFRSPTTTTRDRDAVARLAPLAGIERPAAFGEELLRVKLEAAERKSPAQLVGDDFKEFVMGGRRVGISQVEVFRAGALAARKAAILGELRARREAAGLAQAIFMITSVADQSSELWFVGEKPEQFEQAFGALEDGGVVVPGCMSRKQQVVPRLEAVLR
ncbi:MAG: manganese-dependent inorganic pyrophosphatase [Archangium sp.]|nr:manganese-dependent inorganic pyrophosphatase [Archangium sp.]